MSKEQVLVVGSIGPMSAIPINISGLADASYLKKISDLESTVARLTKERDDAVSKAITLAKGCVDYGGGYRTKEELEIYHHGIQTVVNVLEAWNKSVSTGQNDMQLNAVQATGARIEQADKEVGS